MMLWKAQLLFLGLCSQRTWALCRPFTLRSSALPCHHPSSEAGLSPSRSLLLLRSTTTTSDTTNDHGSSVVTKDDASDSGSKEQQQNEEFDPDYFDAVVCGGGPAGLLGSIMLAQRFPHAQIHVMEANPTPPLPLHNKTLWTTSDALARHYTLGVFGRGKKALERFGAWEAVESIAQELVGSQSFRFPSNNNTTTATTNSSRSVVPVVNLFVDMGREPIYALPRDKLVLSLYQHILEEYPSRIVVRFGQTVTPLDFEYSDKKHVLLEVVESKKEEKKRRRIVTTDFLIGLDGAARTVANRMEEVERMEWKEKPVWDWMLFGGWRRPFAVTRFPDTNPRVYKTIPVQLPLDWRRDVAYTFGNGNDKKRRYPVVSLPSNTKGGLCSIMIMKEGDPLAKPGADPKHLQTVLEENFHFLSDLVDNKVVAAVSEKPPLAFPFFWYAGPRLHKGARTVILSDACHSVKPYNGLGVNSAFKDVKILLDVLGDAAAAANAASRREDDQDDRGRETTTDAPITTDHRFWKTAVEAFSKTRAKDCKAMVTLSRAGDRLSKIGFLL